MRLLRNIKSHLSPSRWQRAFNMGRAYYDTADGDWTAVAVPMRLALRNHREHMAKHQITARWDRDCRQMLIVETLLDRQINGDSHEIAYAKYPEVRDYARTTFFRELDNGNFLMDHAGVRPPTTHACYEFMTEIERQDSQMLARYMKYLTHWWE